MNTTTEHEQLSLIVDELLMLFHESGDFHEDPLVQTVMREAGRAAAAVRRRLRLIGDRYIVAVVGLTNVGKSTLLNALLGSNLAPRRNGPCTAAPIEFMHGEALKVTLCRRESTRRRVWQCDNAEEVHQVLASIADDSGDQASRSVRKVLVECPTPLLRDGLVIADTPGFGAAQASEATGSHENALKQYLKDEVSQVFWVVLADQGIGKRERVFHDQFFGDICDDIVVTGCEDWDTRDRDRFRRRFADAFESRMPRFHFVSGLQGLRARQASDPAGLEAAGITLLESRIGQLSDSEGRLAATRETLLQLAVDLREWLTEYRDGQRDHLDGWWRPDSWSRWSACLRGHPIKEQLSQSLEFAI